MWWRRSFLHQYRLSIGSMEVVQVGPIWTSSLAFIQGRGAVMRACVGLGRSVEVMLVVVLHASSVNDHMPMENNQYTR